MVKMRPAVWQHPGLSAPPGRARQAQMHCKGSTSRPIKGSEVFLFASLWRIVSGVQGSTKGSLHQRRWHPWNGHTWRLDWVP